MNVLILGGTRFIGHHIAARLTLSGHRVTLAHRGKHPSVLKEIQTINLDRNDRHALSALFAKTSYDMVVDTVVYSEKEARLAVEIMKGKTGHYIYISTASVYILKQVHFPPFREQDIFLDPPGSVKFSDRYAYGLNKRKADLYFLRGYEESRFPVTCLRLPVVIGARDYTGRLASYFHRIRDSKPIILPDGGYNTFGFIAAEDVARFIEEFSGDERIIGRGVNLAQREIVTLRQTIKTMAEMMSQKCELVDIPSRYLNKYPVGTNFSPLSYKVHVNLDTGFIMRDLKFSPTPFRVQLNRYLQYLKSSPEKDLFASTRRWEITRAAEYRNITGDATKS